MGLDYLTATETEAKWGLTGRRVSYLCDKGRVSGAVKKSKLWLIPADAAKPADGRYKNGRKPKALSKEAGDGV